MSRFAHCTAFALCVSMVSGSFADEGADSLEFLKPTGIIYQEITRVEKAAGYAKGLTTSEGNNKAWMEPTGGSIDFQMRKNKRLGLEVMISAAYFVAPYHYEQNQNYTRNIAVSAPRLNASYVFGDLAKPMLKVDFGLFSYKYDENSRNLGEYMFRTWAYPGIIQTGGVYNYAGVNGANITGMKLSQTLGNFSHDFIVSLETEMNPFFDLNLTYMAKYKVGDVLKVGGGVQISRLWSAEKDPGMKVRYFQEGGVWYAYGDEQGNEGANYYTNLEKGLVNSIRKPDATAADSARYTADSIRVSAAPALALAINDSVKTAQLQPAMKSFDGMAIKPMAYFSFDPKPLFNADIFGPKDLILYGEAAILGTKNYPVFYTDITRRIPMMLGFNVPAFKLLDVFSVEMEYYRSQFLPTYPFPISLSGTPFPQTPIAYDPKDWSKDDWKWSVYAERSLFGGIMLTTQVASDHSRSWNWDAFGKVPWEMYVKPSEWYWSAKLSAKI